MTREKMKGMKETSTGPQRGRNCFVLKTDFISESIGNARTLLSVSWKSLSPQFLWPP